MKPKTKSILKRIFFLIVVPISIILCQIFWWKNLDTFLWVGVPYLFVLILYLFRKKIKLKKRKTNEWRTLQQFFSEWKQGMENVSPLQQAIVTQWGLIISTIGIIWGIVFSIRIGYYWMMAILIGGLIVVCMNFLGNWQQKTILKKMDDAYNTAEEEVENDGNV